MSDEILPMVASADDTVAEGKDSLRSRLKFLEDFPFRHISLSHLVQLGIAVAVLVAFVRVASISDGNVQLAGGILAATGYFAPLAGLGLIVIPLALVLTAVNLREYRRSAIRAGKENAVSRSAIITIYWLFAALAFLANIWVFLGGLAYILIMVGFDRLLYGRLRDKKHLAKTDQEKNPLRENLGLIFNVLFVVSMTLLSSRTPWLPQEVVVTKSGTVDGYVLSVGQPWATILVDKPRYLLYVRESDIETRTMCSTGSSLTFMQWLQRTDLGSAPDCKAAPAGPASTPASTPAPVSSATAKPTASPGTSP